MSKVNVEATHDVTSKAPHPKQSIYPNGALIFCGIVQIRIFSQHFAVFKGITYERARKEFTDYSQIVNKIILI